MLHFDHGAMRFSIMCRLLALIGIDNQHRHVTDKFDAADSFLLSSEVDTDTSHESK